VVVEWLLIVVTVSGYGYGPTVTFERLDSEEECLRIGMEVKEMFPGIIRTSCTFVSRLGSP
jgi:hypothetical protein